MSNLVRAQKSPLLLLPILVLAIISCHPGGGDGVEKAQENSEQALANREVRLIRPELREEKPILELVGEIRPMDSVTVASELAGRVDAVLVEVGDRVAKGSPLVEIDRETFRLRLAAAEADLAAARADLDLAEKGLARKKDLLSDETISQASYDAAQSGHDLARARLSGAQVARDLAERNLERSLVKATAGGVISARMTAGGQWTDMGGPLLRLAIGDEVKVSARVPEAWAPRLSELNGFEFAVGSGAQRQAKLYSVDPVVTGSSRSFEVVGTAPNADSGLRPGMFATVYLSAPETTRSLWLPASAVAVSDMLQVLVVENGEVAEVKVQTGRRDGDLLEIVSGLSEGREVIEDVSGLHRGLPVTVVE